MFFEVLFSGLAVLADLELLILLLIGVIWGTIGGAVPGISSTLTMAITIPFTFSMQAGHAVAFLLAVTVATSFGNAIPAVLVGLPGTPAAVLTALDGYPLQKRGEGARALAVTYMSSLSGQVVSALFFIAMIVPLSRLAYSFLGPELFALHVLGMAAIVGLTGKNAIKGLIAAAIGLATTVIGSDPVTALPRFSFGVPGLRTGLDILPVILGFLAVSELFRSFRQTQPWSEEIRTAKLKFPNLWGMRNLIPATLVGTVIGTLLGAVPGVGSATGAVVSHQQAKLISKHPEEFGKGSFEGIAANEAAQNASQSGEMVPTLGLGIPGSGSATLILTALTIQGLVPGPLLPIQSPELLHATVAGLIGGAILLSLVGWYMTKALMRIVRLDRSVVMVVALFTMMVGTFAYRNSLLDVVIMLVCGYIGYVMLRYGYSTAAAAIAAVLGAGMEGHLRRGLLLTGGVREFVMRPVTGIVLAISLVFLIYGIYSTIRISRRDKSRAEALIDTTQD